MSEFKFPDDDRTVVDTLRRCRWCSRPLAADLRDSVHVPHQYECPECKASVHPSIMFATPRDDVRTVVWHNPDNSLYIEFERRDGTYARFEISAKALQELGLLTHVANEPMNGKREP